MLKEAHAEFGLQDAQHRPVQDCHIRFSTAEPLPQLLVEARAVLGLHIHARPHAQQPCFRNGFAYLLGIVDIPHRSIVGYAYALEPHFFPEKLRQNFFRGRDRFSVYDAVAGHDPLKPRAADSRLKGFCVYLLQQTVRYVAVGPMDSSLGIMKSQKMLCHGFRSSSGDGLVLDALYIGGSHSRGQRGILPIGLPLPSHSGIS